MSILKISKSNPVPSVKNFLAPFSKLSLKYPVLKKNALLNEYSSPIAHVISFNSSVIPSGASSNYIKIPFKKLTLGCL